MRKADQIGASGGESSILPGCLEKLVCLFIYIYFMSSSAGTWGSEMQGPAVSSDRWQAEPKCWHHRQPLRIFLCNAGVGYVTEE